MEKRIAVVTGATSGIGRAIAQTLVERGWTVHGVGRRADALETERSSLGERFVPQVCDVTDDASVDELASAIGGLYGPVHGLVNAAGILESGSVASTPMDSFDRVMSTNVRSLFKVSQAFLPLLRAAAPNASIVNVSSVAGLRPYPNLAAYCTSKAAVDQITRCMAAEEAEHRVRVNAINPGVVRTDLHLRGGMTAEAYADFLERGRRTHPLGRVGEAPEIADLVEFLLSDRAAWITGDTVSIDGGRHLAGAR